MDILKECQNVFDIEISQLQQMRDSLDETIVEIVHQVHKCQGKTIICGMGKPGHIARKIAASLSSLGIESFYLHPAEGLHGDLGSLSQKDIIILISNSGNSQEMVNLFPTLKMIGITTIAITSNEESELGKHSDIVLCTHKIKEACALDLAPTSSTTVELVIGDAIAVVASKLSSFKREDFALFHPAGALGKKLLTQVGDIMYTGEDLPIIKSDSTIKEALVKITEKSFGTVLVVDELGKMIGIITDGDIRRTLGKNIDIYTCTAKEIMTIDPVCISKDVLAVDALKQMTKSKRPVAVLPVVDEDGRAEGIIRNSDILRNGIIL